MMSTVSVIWLVRHLRGTSFDSRSLAHVLSRLVTVACLAVVDGSRPILAIVLFELIQVRFQPLLVLQIVFEEDIFLRFLTQEYALCRRVTSR